MQTFDFFILGAMFGLFVFYKFLRYYKRKKGQMIVHRARKAENSAVKVLQNAGYKIIDIQKRVKIKTKINGKYYSNTIIADMLVKKAGKVYLVEIKTGKQGKPISPLIRRQLLEYYLVYRPDGLILLDMEKRKIHHISFELENTWKNKPFLGYIVSFCVGMILTLFFILLKQ